MLGRSNVKEPHISSFIGILFNNCNGSMIVLN
jgi:hypothetical protein